MLAFIGVLLFGKWPGVVSNPPERIVIACETDNAGRRRQCFFDAMQEDTPLPTEFGPNGLVAPLEFKDVGA